METQIPWGERYEDLTPTAPGYSQYSLSTRIEGRIRYALHKTNPIRFIRTAWGYQNPPGKSLENFLKQITEEKEAEARNKKKKTITESCHNQT